MPVFVFASAKNEEPSTAKTTARKKEERRVCVRCDRSHAAFFRVASPCSSNFPKQEGLDHSMVGVSVFACCLSVSVSLSVSLSVSVSVSVCLCLCLCLCL